MTEMGRDAMATGAVPVTLRVLHLNNDLGTAGGGVTRMIRDYAPALARHGVEVHVASGEESIASLPGGVTAHHPLPDLLDPGAPQARWGPRMDQILDRNGIDVVHVSETRNASIVDHLLGRVPAVAHIHNYVKWCPGSDLFYETTEERCPLSVGWKCVPNAYTKRCNSRHPKHLARSIRRTVEEKRRWRTPLRFVTSSEYMRQRAGGAGMPVEKIDVVPYAIDADRFGARASAPPPAAPSPGFILFVGRLVRMKGVHYLLDALADDRLSAARLVVVGDGHERSDLEARARERGVADRVSFTGWLDGPELSWMFENCALLAVPSLWDEVFGMVGLEAMAVAKPVVAFDVGGISQWLDRDVTGTLVPVRDLEGLTRGLAGVLDDPGRADRLGRAGRSRYLDHFTTERQAPSMRAVYERTIAEFSCTSAT
jgi:glycosyltransferase involved in cell wall biosynthesis